MRAGKEVGERWSPPAAVRGRGVQGGEAPMGASRPHGCWVLAGLGPPAWAQRCCHGHRDTLKASPKRPQESLNRPRGHRATPKVTEPPQRVIKPPPRGHRATPKVIQPPQRSPNHLKRAACATPSGAGVVGAMSRAAGARRFLSTVIHHQQKYKILDVCL